MNIERDTLINMINLYMQAKSTNDRHAASLHHWVHYFCLEDTSQEYESMSSQAPHLAGLAHLAV